MKRFTTLALIVFALAAVPAAFADDGSTPPATPAPAATQPATPQDSAAGNAGRAGVRTRVEILRLRLQIVQLRFTLHCRGGKNTEKCTAFAQKVEQRLATLDGNVQKKIAELQQCTTTSADPKCKNADKKIALLQNVDTHLQNLIQRVQNWLSGNGDASTSPEQALDQAASALAGSNG